MNTKQYNTLITKAKQIMSKSLDPIHDLSHVERVVKTTKKMCHEMQLKEADRQILTLAAWWHDTSRTKTRKPSILLMPFLDDAFSALLLWVAFRRRLNSLWGNRSKEIKCQVYPCIYSLWIPTVVFAF